MAPHPHVVYHVAGMGDWKAVVLEQLALLREVGLTDDIRITYLGREREWLEGQLHQFAIKATIVRADENTDHCETLAMLEIDQMAKVEQVTRPILYMHTKGVSAPGNHSKRDWRHLMEAWVIKRWRINLNHLLHYDAVGVNWIEGGPQHFSGTFWISNPDWIRRLPDFGTYHVANGLNRYTCEMWIGATQWCNALSLACMNEPFWNHAYDYRRWMPQESEPINGEGPPVGQSSRFGELFNWYGTDKDSDHTYGPVYDRIFPLESRPFVKGLLEVGVQSGRSLMAWESAFPNAAVYGMDLSDRLEGMGTRTRVIIGDATRPSVVAAAMNRLRVEHGSIDLFVDDGSHRFVDQLATAVLFKPYIAADGVMVIEDVYPVDGAAVLARAIGGFVLDRRGERQRFDDVMVVAGRNPEDFADLQRPVEFDMPSPFAGH